MRDVLEQNPAEMVDTAQLLVSELVTNAVVHANTEVEVRAWSTDGRAHVHVSDHRPSRGLVTQQFSTYASTGRGLEMVERLSSNHGVHMGEDRKTVWFELWPDTAPPAAGWDTSATTSGPTVTVTLIDVPGALHKAAQQHREALLREVLLTALADDRPTAPLEDLFTAHECNHMIRAALLDAPEQRQSGHGDLHTLRAPIPADATTALRTLDRMLEFAQEEAREGRLLTRPALPQTRAATRWLLDQIGGQLAGRRPTAWTSFPHDPSAVPPEPAPWDPGSLHASATPTIAADDADRIIAVNAPAAGLLGWPADELVGRRITEVIPEHLRDRHVAAFTSLLLTGESHILGRPVTMSALHHDGRLVPITLLIQTQEARDGRSVFVARLHPARHGEHPTGRP